jgi:glycerophosphoryl diester phosphodiesterase
MSCAKEKSINIVAPSWKSKFPTLVIAHRGFSGAAPENTLAAFKKAIEVGSDMIELDAHLSKDGKVIVIHDDILNRTTNGIGKVSNYTLEQLKQLDAGSWFSAQFEGERIPTLREVLELTHRRIFVIIEIKSGDLGLYGIRELAQKALKEVERAGMENQVLFCSFDPQALQRIQEKNPRIPTALILSKKWDFPEEVTEGKSYSLLSCRKSVLTPTNLLRAKQKGLKVFAWTLNTEEEMEQFLDWGIDGIITNYPDRLIKILRKRTS